MYIVYHRRPIFPGLVFSDQEAPPAANSSRSLSEKLDWPASYQEVAQVEAKTLQEVFFKTQHLESVWWHNPGVTATQISRSTSVGDVIQDKEHNFWLVAADGFVMMDTHT